MSDPATFPWAEFVKAIAPLGTLVAAIVGGIVAWRIHSDKKKHENLRDEIAAAREMKLASVVAAHHLSVFIRGCIAVAHDEGLNEYGQPAGPDDGHNFRACAATTTMPTWIPGELDVEWKYLDADLTDKLFELSILVETANNKIANASFEDDPPYYPNYFNARRLLYAELALYAHRIRADLLHGAVISFGPTRAPERLRDNEITIFKMLGVIKEITKNEADGLATNKMPDLPTEAKAGQP